VEITGLFFNCFLPAAGNFRGLKTCAVSPRGGARCAGNENMTFLRLAAVTITALLLFVPAHAKAQLTYIEETRINTGAEEAEIRNFNRKQQIEAIHEYDREHKQAELPPQKANAGELAAERARSEEVARLSEQGRNASKKAPSAVFLATQARFNDAHKPAIAAPEIQPVVTGKTPQTQNEGSARIVLWAMEG
jgi:hypothetical protein